MARNFYSIDSYDKLFCKCDNLLPRSNASIDDEDMADITDWTDADVGNGVSSQDTFDGKSCMKLDTGAATSPNYALRRQDLGTFGNRTVLSASVYIDVAGTGIGNSFYIRAETGATYSFLAYFYSGKLLIYDNQDGAQEVGTNIAPGGEWAEWTFDINWVTPTVDVYKNGILQGANINSGWEQSGNMGHVYFLQNGTTEANRITYVDWLKVGDNFVYTTFADSSTASPKTITANGNATQLPIKFNKSAGFFGSKTADYVALADSADFDFGTGDFTIEGFIFLSTADEYFPFLKYSAPNGWFVSIEANVNNKISLYSSSAARLYVTHTWVLNTWVHLAITRSGNDLKFYVDGVQVGATQDCTGVSYDGGAEPLKVGLLTNGWMKELRISKVARTITVPTVQYTTDSDTILLMHFDTPATSPLGPAIAFDGTGDYLELADSADWDVQGNAFSFEAWVYPTAIGSTVKTILARPTANYTYYVGIAAAGNAFFFSNHAGGGPQFNCTSTTVLAVNRWYHIRAVSTGSAQYILINGQPEDTDNYATPLTDTNVGIYIGATSAAASPFSGYMREIVFSKSNLGTDAFTPSQTGFTVDANTKLYIKGDENNGSPNRIVTMTSNTAPSPYKAYQSSVYTTYDAYLAMDGQVGSGHYWQSATTGTQWIALDYGSAITINGYSLLGWYDGASNSPYTWKVQGSNNSTDGSDGTWTDLDSQVHVVTSITKKFFPILGAGSYRWYRLYITEIDGSTTYTVQTWDLFRDYVADSATTPKAITVFGDTKIKYTEDYRSCIFKDETGKFPYPVGSAKVDFFAIGSGVGLFTTTGDNISTPHSTDFDFGTGAWHIGYWMRRISVASAHSVMAKYSGTGWEVYENGTTWRVYLNAGNLSQTLPAESQNLNTWQYYEVDRNANTLYWFYNGTLVGTSDATGLTYDGANTNLIVGGGATSNLVQARLDNIRISKGVARYIATFNPPEFKRGGNKLIMWVN